MILDEDVILGEETGVGIIPDEAPVEETQVETPVGTQPEETPTETKTETVSWLDELNKSFGTSFTALDELKSKIEATVPPEQESGLKGEFEALKAKHEKLIEEYKKNADPLGLFSSETELKKNLLMKSNPNINGEVGNRIFNIDLEKGDPLDIIALDMMLNYKSIKSGDAAKAYFKSKNGIDAESFEDMTEDQVLTINIEAERAAKNIAAIRDSVSLPQSRSIDDVLAEASFAKEPEYDISKWDGKIDNVVNSLKEIKIDVGDFTYTEAVDAEFKEGLAEVVKETIIKGKIDPTPENIALLVKEAEIAYKTEKFDEITRRIVNQAKVKFKEETHRAIHNDADPDKVTVTAPATSGKTTDLLKQWGIPRQ